MKPYYEHGGITIYHGDCREIVPVLGRPGFALTDPPYGIQWRRGRWNHRRPSKAHKGILGDHDTTLRDEVLELLSIPAIVFGSPYAPYPQNLKQALVWHKSPDSGVFGSTTGYRRDWELIFLVGQWPMTSVQWSGILRTHRGISSIATDTGHPHTKPLELIRLLLERSGFRSVIDPFMGSGTTLIAAKALGVFAIGIEIEEKYCEIAAKRLSQEVLRFEAKPFNSQMEMFT